MRRDEPTPDAALLAKASDPESGWLTLWLIAMRRHHPAISRALAANPAAPRSLLGLIGRFGRWDVAIEVARNPRCTRGLYQWFMMSSDWAVVAAVASSPTAPPHLLGRLAGRHDGRIAMAAAGNPRLSPEYVAALLRSEDVYVRGVAAANPSAPAEQLRQLASDLSQPAWILRAIGANPSCPEDLSDQLLTWITLGGPGKADPLFDPVSCTGHPGNTDEPMLAWYAEQARQDAADRYPLWRVRAMYPSMRPKVQFTTLEQLRRDPRPEVRRAVAGFVGVRPRAVRELAGDADPIVARKAMQVRVTNRRRYVRRRLPRLGRLALRLTPLIFVVVGIALTNARNNTVPRVTFQTTPQTVQVVPRVSQSDLCATSAQWLRVVSAPGVRAAPATPPRVVTLPGGGWMTCGPATAGREALLVSAGSTRLSVRVAGTVRRADGRHLTDATVPIPAARKVVLYLPSNPSVATMTIIAADRPSFVITAILTFGQQQP
jgi:hypothetical protein